LREARAKLGATTLLLGHHYQRDEVIRFADATGDSYKLSRIAAETPAKYIVFCGVHFMAESADVLSHPGQQVILA
jgi:quinolinate synthase